MENNDAYEKFAMGKQNLILIAIGFAIVVLGFILMMGAPSTETAYNPDIFGFRRTVLGPGISLGGFMFVIVGILFKKKIK
jgi:uncharacterized membrane protein